MLNNTLTEQDKLGIIRNAFPVCIKCGRELKGGEAKTSKDKLFRVECKDGCKQ